MGALPHHVHYQATIATIANKHNLSGVFYLDLWPVACGQLVVLDPDVASYMTITKNHPKHDAEKWFIDPLIGSNNIVTSNGPHWKYLHKMLSPAFAIQHISNMRSGIAEELMEFRSMLNEKAESGEKFSLEDLTLRTTFDVVGKATFGHSLNAKREGSIALEHWEAMSRAFASTRESYNFVAHFFARRRTKLERKKLDAILADMVKKRFDAVVHEKTDLSERRGLAIMDLILRDYMSEVQLSGKHELDPKFLEAAVTQVKTLLVGGTGTTSDVICYATMMLSVHPEVVRKLREEHDTVFTKGIEASYEMLQHDPYKLNQLEYTTNVIKEVLRFYPVGNTARKEHPTEPFLSYDGRQYSTKGKMVCPVQFQMHMNGDIFPNPKKFDPERYTRQDFARHAWRPFERGPRSCLGQPLAMDELKIALLLTIREFDFTCADLNPNKTPRVGWTDWDLTFGDRAFQQFVFEARPRDGMPMTVKRSNWPS
ncbi:cytochrome P450 [Ophiobolus disseminans]|uniref:Cytochrome P450 n=1 Tax=Ophiobolus disseminans TaxID=1469910 RepID=A0A6A7AGJ4_9PLEO|nr:cytochrome P450 [Ophiobolus disseminans]